MSEELKELRYKVLKLEKKQDMLESLLKSLCNDFKKSKEDKQPYQEEETFNCSIKKYEDLKKENEELKKEINFYSKETEIYCSDNTKLVLKITALKEEIDTLKKENESLKKYKYVVEKTLPLRSKKSVEVIY